MNIVLKKELSGKQSIWYTKGLWQTYKKYNTRSSAMLMSLSALLKNLLIGLKSLSMPLGRLRIMQSGTDNL